MRYGEESCAGCGYLCFTPPANRYDVWTAHCCDPDKPMTGRRRVIQAGGVKPGRVLRPVWCRKDAKKPPSAMQAEGGGRDKRNS